MVASVIRTATGGAVVVSESIECVVIGAGAVGLATARALALAGHEVVVLEAGPAIGAGVSSRSSEVIHAGMYYPEGSLKARLCVRGNGLLRGFLADHNVAHAMPGKLIVANGADEEEKLASILALGRANGVGGLAPITAAEARRMEPQLTCTAALWSPATGIFDTHGYMLALLGDAERAGASLALKSPVRGGAVGDGIVLDIGGEAPMRLSCRRLVNAAGLGAQAVAGALSGLPAERVPPLHLCKGNYFYLSGRRPFARLVYPTPQSAGLGVHFTLDLAGQGRFGPDVEWVDAEDYSVDLRRADSFYAAVRRYWPGLPDDALRPAYAGIRPKVQAPGAPARDFIVEGPDVHGIPGLVNLFGIESPGLTASLALAEQVAEILA